MSRRAHNGDVHIRRARLADLETIVDFNEQLARETEGVQLDLDRLRAGVESMLRDDRAGFYLLAETDDGETLGQVGLTFEWSDWRNGVFWWLQSVYVRPEYRGQGVLRALYDRILALSADRSVCGIRLYVEHENRAAQAAYCRLGLEPAVFQMYERDFVIDRGKAT